MTMKSEFISQTLARVSLAGVIGILTYQAYGPQDSKQQETTGDPVANKMLPQECLTPEFFTTLNTDLTQGNYEAAVDSFLNPKERAYATTLGNSGTAEEELVRAFGLRPFLATVEVCGTPETPTCEDLVINKNCDCPKYDYSSSKYVVNRIANIKVHEGTNSIEGIVDVRFRQPMQYAIIEGIEVTVRKLPAEESFQTTFRPHWNYEAKTK